MKTALLTLSIVATLAGAIAACSAPAASTKDSNNTSDKEKSTDKDNTDPSNKTATPPPAATPNTVNTTTDAGTPINASSDPYIACMTQCAAGDAQTTQLIQAMISCDSVCPQDDKTQPSQACLTCDQQVGQTFDQQCGTDQSTSKCQKFDQCDSSCASKIPNNGQGGAN